MAWTKDLAHKFQMLERTDRRTDDPNTRCPRRTFKAGGIKIGVPSQVKKENIKFHCKMVEKLQDLCSVCRVSRENVV